MKATDIATDRSSKAMGGSLPVFLVAGNIERFRDETALKSDVLRATRTERLVNAPGDRAVVDDAMVTTGDPHAVHGLSRQIAEPQPDEADEENES